ncbi:MAG: Ig-like domain-containing protein [Candidatus Ozemobacteraceae bacterium]
MRHAVRTLLVILICLAGPWGVSYSFAEAPTGISSALVVSDENKAKLDGIAAIGETIKLQVLFSSNAENPVAFADMKGAGGPLLNMTVVPAYPAGAFLGECEWKPVTAGTADGSSIFPDFYLGNASTATIFPFTPIKYPSPVSIVIDNKQPQRASIMSAKVGGVTYTSGMVVKQNQQVVFTQELTTTDMGSASVNLVTAGLPTVNTMTWNNSTTLTLSNIVFPADHDGVYNFPIGISDERGNYIRYTDFNMSVDTEPPVISAATVVNSTVVKGTVLPGHLITLECTITKYDHDSVVASQSQLSDGGIPMPIMNVVGTPNVGDPCTFRGTILLASNSSVFNNNYIFEFIANDNATNTVSRLADPIKMDLNPPGFLTSSVVIYLANEDIPTATSVATIGTRLSIQANITTAPSVDLDPLTVVASMTSIDGVGDYVLTHISGTNSYIGTYSVPVGSLEKITSYQFTVYAKDSAGNLVFMSTTPAFWIDNRPPVFVGVPTITRLSGGTTPYHIGDSLIFSAQVNNLADDLPATVSCDLSRLGGSANTIFTPDGGNTWSKTIIVATSTPSGYSAGYSFRVRATDDYGNIASATTAPCVIDNEPPVILTASWTAYPPASVAPYIGIGASVTFSVTLASTTGNTPYDGQTVSIDLTLAGEGIVPMTLSGGKYSCVYLVKAGPLNDGATFPLIITDAGGNSAGDWGIPLASPVIRIPTFDQNPPDPSGIQLVINSTPENTGGLYTINLNCSTTFRINLTQDNLPDAGTSTIDLSYIGYSAFATMPASPVLYSPLTSIFELGPLVSLPTLVEAPVNYRFPATVTDKAGNITTVNSISSYTVDCIRPRIDHCTAQIVGGQTTAIIGTQIGFHCRTLDTDGGVPYIDLSSLGKTSREPMIASAAPIYAGDGWDYFITIATGAYTNLAASFVVTIDDNAGNEAVATSTPSVLIDNSPPNISGLLVYVNSQLATPGTMIKFGDQVHFSIPFSVPPDDIASAGSAPIDLTPIGFGASVFMATPTVSTHSFELATKTAATTIEYSNYVFSVTVSDKYGNVLIATAPPILKIDCQAPKIIAFTAEVLGGKPAAIIGTDIAFHCQTTDVNGEIPRIDLSSIGKTWNESMIASAAPTYPGQGWDYVMTIATGAYTNMNASFVVTIIDSVANTASAPSTPVIKIDNRPPDVDNLLIYVNTQLATAGTVIKFGDLVQFSIPYKTPFDDIASAGTAPIDLTAIGWGPSFVLASPTATHTSSFELILTSAAAVVEYSNYVFSVTVTDNLGNIRIATAAPVLKIDCKVPQLSNIGLMISENNGDNPFANIANPGDILTLYADITNLPTIPDVVATLTWTALSTTSSFIPMSASFTYVSGFNRYQSTFVVPDTGTPWGDGATFSYSIYVQDDVGNVASITASSAIQVDNVPGMATVTWWLDPDFPANSPLHYFINVASGSKVDLLNVGASFSELLTRGIVNLSAFPGGPAALSMISTGNEAATSGIDLSKYSQTDYLSPTTLQMTLYDRGNNATVITRPFAIDTKRPSVTGITFDGATMTLTFSEEVKEATLQMDRFSIWGTDEFGIATSLNLVGAAKLDNVFSIDVSLTSGQRRTLVQWASQPLYLSVSTDPTAPFKDALENWGKTFTMQPITITSSAWREAPTITSFLVTQNWTGPTSKSIVIDFYFSKIVDTNTLATSNGVLFVTVGDFSSVDYQRSYVFQPTDTIEWFPAGSPTNMRVSLGSDGGDWVARKLGNGSTPLKFCTRTSSAIFVRDELGKPMAGIVAASAKSAAVLRPYQTTPNNFSVESGTASGPWLDLGSGTYGRLGLTMTDDALLYLNDFDTPDTITPRMDMPTPTAAQRHNAFHYTIQLHDIDASPATYTTLSLDVLDTLINSQLSNRSVKLDLTSADLQNVLGLFRNNPSPNWRLRVNSGSFINWWSQPVLAYKDTLPGTVQIATPAISTPFTLAGVAFSDPSPTKFHSALDLTMEFEILPTAWNGAYLPIASTTPTMQLHPVTGTSWAATGKFLGWTTRWVAGEGRPRYIARFVNAQDLPPNVQRDPAQVDLSGVKDVFNNSVSLSTTQVYAIAARDNSLPTGFSQASDTLLIDSQSPNAVGVTPADVIGQTPAGMGEFHVSYDEGMDPDLTYKPTLQLATTGVTLSFTFKNWDVDGTALFTNVQTITASTPNGVWNYIVSGGRDLAGNPLAVVGNFPIEMHSQGPAPLFTTWTRQPVLSLDVLKNQPFSPLVGDGSATIQLDYTSDPTFIPHFVQVFNPSGALVATFPTQGFNPLISNFPNASSLWKTGTFPGLNQGPILYKFRVIDDIENQTVGYLNGGLTYDSAPPDITGFYFDDLNRGITVDGVKYYSPALGSATISVKTDALDILRLVVASSAFAYPETVAMNRGGSGHTVYFGGSLGECFATLTVADLAGNPGTGSGATFTVRVDRTAPAVAAVSPDSPMGGISAGEGTFEVTFSEPMNPAFVPSVLLVNGSTSIVLKSSAPTCWISPTLARFSNRDAIINLPVGDYAWTIGTARDYAGNIVATNSFKMYISSTGIGGTIRVLTRQPQLSPNILIDSPFSPAAGEVGNSSASVEIDFTGQTNLNPPYQLLTYDSNGVNVATFSVGIGNPGIALFTDNPTFWAPGKTPGTNTGPVTYRFKLRDYLGNNSPVFLTGNLIFDNRPAAVSSFGFNDSGRGLLVDGIRYYAPGFGSATITLKTDASDDQRLIIASNPVSVEFPKVVPLSRFSTEYSVLYGGSLEECLATFTIADLAGNFGTGAAATLSVRVDRTVPTVTAISPSGPLGAIPAGAGVFEITFSEPMNTTVAPIVTLSNGGTVIRMSATAPACWLSPTRSRLTNTDPIVNLPVGSYTWFIGTARDYAGNVIAPSTFQVWINSQGTTGLIKVLTRQPALFADILVDVPFSPLAGQSGNSSATVLIDFGTQANLNPPYKLITYDQSDVNVATFSVSGSNPGTAVFSTASEFWATGKAPGTNEGPRTYKFKLLDSLNNLSAAFISSSLVYDTRPAIVSAFDFNDAARGITVGGIRYYSPALAQASITVRTDSSDAQMLVVGTETGILPAVIAMNRVANDHSIGFGTSLPEGLATFTIADLAGNFGTGAGAVLSVRADRTSPTVTAVSPNTPIGAVPSGMGTFEIVFSEPMNSAIAPVVTLVNGGTSIKLDATAPTCWVTTTRARLTNHDSIRNLPIGSYTWSISAARDYAGNVVTSSAFEVWINSQGTNGSVYILTRQPVLTQNILFDLPYSPQAGQAGNSSATVLIDLTTQQNLTPPYRLLVQETGVNVATFSVAMVGNSGTAIFSTNSANWALNKVPGTNEGPKTYMLRLIDGLGNVSVADIGSLTYDSRSAAVNSFDFADGGHGIATEGIRYYSPSLGPVVLTFKTDSTDSQRLVVASNAAVLPQLIALAANGTDHSVTFGDALDECLATFTIVDAAGNFGTGASASLLVRVDRTPPTVVSVFPTATIGGIDAGTGLFEVTFSERMQSGFVPTVTLENGSVIVHLTPIAGNPWVNPSVCRFTNQESTRDLPVGTYSWKISGACDLSGLSLLPSAFQTAISPTGALPSFAVLTRQPALASDILINQPFSTSVGDGSATIRLEFTPTEQLGAPHRLVVYNELDVSVATLPVLAGAIGQSVFPGDAYNWTSGMYPTADQGPVSYRCKVIDSQNNLSSRYLGTLTFDSRPAHVSAFTLDDSGRGLVVDGLKYYSPALGLSNVLAKTDAFDAQRLVISTLTTLLPMIAPLTAVGADHSVTWGSGTSDGIATLSIADLAGNPGQGQTLRVVVDGTAPKLATVSPSSTTIGGFSSNSGRFDLTFSEPMRSDTAPAAGLRFGDYVVTLVPFVPAPGCWISSTTCRMTNFEALTDFPVGEYSYFLTGSTKDLAGNVCKLPAIGAVTVFINSAATAYIGTLRTRQQDVTGDVVLIDRPFSPLVSPLMGTFTLEKLTETPGIPASVLVYSPTDTVVASVPLVMSGTIGTATVNAAFFGNPGAIGPVPYTLRIADMQGNLSDSVKQVVYDAVAPSISTFTLRNAVGAYSPTVRGPLAIVVNSTATDTLRVVLPVLTGKRTYELKRDAFNYSGSIPVADFDGLSDGDYTLSIVDDAGNSGIGAAPSVSFKLDRTPPLITSITSLPAGVFHTLAAGAATFSITFNEPMNRLASANPVVSLATAGAVVPFRFVRWAGDRQAHVTNDVAITPNLPDGPWDLSITAYDQADNRVATTSAGFVTVSPRGPRIAQVWAESFQQTTATSATSILINAPFSMKVAPNAATLKVELNAAAVEPVKVQFTQNDVVVGVYPIVFTNGKASFIWNSTRGPLPTVPTTYLVKFLDGVGNLAVETFSWTCDPEPPAVQSLSTTGGITATGTIYFNPARHSFVTTTWKIDNEPQTPLARVCGGGATMTSLLSANGSLWNGRFDGKDISGAILPDGFYTVDTVDAAGNVGQASIPGDPCAASILIDRVDPVVATITTLVNGQERNRFSPKAGYPMDVVVDSTEPLDPSSLWTVEVRTESGALINTLMLESSGGSYVAHWDGKQIDGKYVGDGFYRLYAADLTGNRAPGYAVVYVVNVDFRMTGASEVTAKSIQISFNQDIDPGSLDSANLSFEPAVSDGFNVTLESARKLVVEFSSALTHATTYTVTAGAGGLLTLDGIPLLEGGNTARFTADTQGPNLLRVGFEGITLSTEVIAYFSKALTTATAQNINSYELRIGSKTGTRVTINRASLRSDGLSVLLSVTGGLSDRVSYVLSAPGVTDAFGNKPPLPLVWTLPFTGIDVTAPEVTLVVFSNPVSDSDLLIAASVSEVLREAPTLIVRQSNGSDITVTMNAGVAAQNYMAGVHLDPALGGTGIVRVTATDPSGNAKTVEKSFTTRMITASLRAAVMSADKRLTAVFAPGVVRGNTFVKIISQELELRAPGIQGAQTTQGAQVAQSRLSPLPSYIGRLVPDGNGSMKLLTMRSSGLSASSVASTSCELESLGGAWEISFPAANLAHPFAMNVQPSAAEAHASMSSGLGVFRYDEGAGWTWLSSRKEKGLWAAESSKPGLIAVLRDRLAPRMNVTTVVDPEKPFATDRPRFEGHVDEFGSGLADGGFVAEIDGIEQAVTMTASDGSFVFIPIAPLTGGNHELRFRASDRVGNTGITPRIAFEVKVPLAVSEMVTYPNPARSRVTLRIGTNQPSLGVDMIEVKIYDVAGHRVRILDNVRPAAEAALAARYVYDIMWDLRNEDGVTVANGVYFAKIEVRDPETGRKVKKTQKVAVLR